MDQNPSNNFSIGAILTKTINYPIVKWTNALMHMNRIQPPELMSKQKWIKSGQCLTPTKTD
jgi:hypothetical protein